MPESMRRLLERQESQHSFLSSLEQRLRVFLAAYRRLLKQCKRLSAQLEKRDEELADAENRVGELSLEYQRARDREKSVLEGLLPESIAEAVAENPRQLIAEDYEAASVLSASMVDFDKVTAGFSAVKLVESLNQLFSVFDVMVLERGLVRVRSTGDSYMCVAGAPSRRQDHAQQAADLALEMMAIVRRLRLEERNPLSMRIGIHCGPLIAGVIGERRPAWDLFGPTVKRALLTQESAPADSIQISSEFKALLGDGYAFSPVAKQMDTGESGLWILHGRRP